MEYFERPTGGELAILVHLELQHHGQDEDLEEFRMLAASADVEVLHVITGSRQRPDPRLYAGTGISTFGNAITRDDLATVEAEVNARIRENAEVTTRLMTPDAAVAEGARALTV